MGLRTILVVTGTRAEYGVMRPLLREIDGDADLRLQLLVTGTHLLPEFGSTINVVEQDGFRVDAKVDMLLASDTGVGVAKSMGLATIGAADALERLAPDFVVVLGDRFEILAVAQAALVMRIPVVHIAGGDTTEGAFDESIRHAVTKMAHLHFVTNARSYERVVRMGESPNRVFDVGSLTIDAIKEMDFMSRSELESDLGFEFLERNVLVTFHPVTLEEDTALAQFQELLGALERLGPKVGIIMTGSNADPGGRSISGAMRSFADRFPDRVRAVTSLGHRRYLSTMRLVDAVVGNSSSGLYEAPSFEIPTVNIGDRQKGRTRAASVIDCEPVRSEIFAAIRRALEMDCSGVKSPFGDGGTAPRIRDVLKSVSLAGILKKPFYEGGRDS